MSSPLVARLSWSRLNRRQDFIVPGSSAALYTPHLGSTLVCSINRRSHGFLVAPPEGMSLTGVPAVDFLGEEHYIKPDAAQLMASPGDETPVVPQDIQADDMDVALSAQRLRDISSV